MQAIIAKYLPATNYKPSRVKASCERGSLTLSYDTGMDTHDAFSSVVDALCAKFDAEDEEKHGVRENQWSRPKAIRADSVRRMGFLVLSLPNSPSTRTLPPLARAPMDCGIN